MPAEDLTPRVGDHAGGAEERIAPLAYLPPEPAPREARRPRRHHPGIAAALLAVAAIAWFLLGARVLEVRVQPGSAQLDVDGGPALAFGTRILLRPGDYVLRAAAPGYAPGSLAVRVTAAGGQRVELALKKLPGRVFVNSAPVAGRVLVDGTDAGATNGEALRLAAGEHTIRVEAERYLPHEQTLAVEGMDIGQTLDVMLAPGWGTYRLETVPPGATVLADDASVGTTPADIELPAGQRHLRLRLEGYRDEALMVSAVAGETRTLPTLTLARADARLRIRSNPAGASITLDGTFQGRTPLELAIDSSQPHELIAFKSGFERAVRALPAGGKSRDIALELRALSGEIRLAVTPPDAEVFVGDRLLGRGAQTLTLPGGNHTLRVQREGYAPQELAVTPRPGFPQSLGVTLATLAEAKAKSTVARVTTAAGQEMVLLRPGPFAMGSSRREVGRRANEALRQVRLQRPFYLGVAEVSNAEFRQFRAGHSSGDFKGNSLNGDGQPAVNLGWEDAALYCNWLSAKEGLPPFYTVQGGRVTGFSAASRGYRLPTEAEWAWAAIVQADGSSARFGWGQELPPTAKAGNFADQSGATLLGQVIAGYDDGFPVAAPRKRFAPNRHGLFDLSGNAAEWIHDIYEALPPDGRADPAGPGSGEFHVIRGASWRHGSVTELRLAFRDYGKEARADLGLRLARYAE
jgi:formylglycine-generating enzyme required for sulfatase activity